MSKALCLISIRYSSTFSDLLKILSVINQALNVKYLTLSSSGIFQEFYTLKICLSAKYYIYYAVQIK